MKRKIRVGIIFGGKSAEHEVSLQSAKNIINFIDREKYEPILIAVDKSGAWHLTNSKNFLLNSDDPKLIKLNPECFESIAIVPQGKGEIVSLTNKKKIVTVDVFFPILHGPFGEDGTVQGLLKLADVPFVGSGVLSSAIGMDKDITKRLLCEARIPTAKSITVKWNRIPSYNTIVKTLGLPFFVKPANLGSSVGISKIKEEGDYEKAVVEAYSFDRKILIEEYIEGREVECAVLGNEIPVISYPGEVIPSHEFYSYEAKYLDRHGAKLVIPAKLPARVTARVLELANLTFQTLECEGMCRIDFFVKKNGDVLVNEINTIPGFTAISMYPKLWEYQEISYTELINDLIQFALERFKKERKLKTNYRG